MYFFGKPVLSVNVEPTNKCVLGCSACDRTLRPEAVKILEDIDPEIFRKVLFEDLASHSIEELPKFDFCGIYGDSIYHKQIFSIFRLIKSRGGKLSLETNGSYKTYEWWNELFSILDDRDEITFSVDGLKDTNEIYRTNSDWDSIYSGMYLAGKSKVKSKWKFIIFSHNEHQIEKAKELAAGLDFDEFLVRKSGRFVENDPLRPSDENVGLQQYHREHFLSGKELKIVPRCTRDPQWSRNVGFTYQGYVIPCLTFHSIKNEWFEENKHKINMKERHIQDILNDPIWKDLQRLWETPENAPRICSLYCGVPKYEEIDPNRIKINDYEYFDLKNRGEV